MCVVPRGVDMEVVRISLLFCVGGDKIPVRGEEGVVGRRLARWFSFSSIILVRKELARLAMPPVGGPKGWKGGGRGGWRCILLSGAEVEDVESGG